MPATPDSERAPLKSYGAVALWATLLAVSVLAVIDIPRLPEIDEHFYLFYIRLFTSGATAALSFLNGMRSYAHLSHVRYGRLLQSAGAAAVFAVVLVAGSLFPSRLPTNEQPNIQSKQTRIGYFRNDHLEGAIVFVPGLFGDRQDTWTNQESGAYWPELLTKDALFQNEDIYVYAHSVAKLTGTYTLDELINVMQAQLVEDGVFANHRRIIFLCHSLGGPMVRGLLTRHPALAAQVSFLYFFSSPANGGDIARITQLLKSDRQLTGLLPIETPSSLSIIETAWEQMPHRPKAFCAYETRPTAGIILTKQGSTGILCTGPSLLLDRDHLDIVKPRDASDQSYVAFAAAYRENAGNSTQVPTLQTVTRTAERYFEVSCNQTSSGVLTIGAPGPIRPADQVTVANVALDRTDNLKDSSARLVGSSGHSASVQYFVNGLDREWTGNCRGGGHGTVVVTFNVTGPLPQ